jgi:biotin-dependent carboxylase-like uncharacterized protein
MRIIKPGLFTTIQDRGRFGHQKSGIPVAGAMDEYALRVGNLLVGNAENEACLEMTFVGPTIEFLANGLVALTGGDLGAVLNNTNIESWQSFAVKQGDSLRFTGAKNGSRGYLALAGGLKLPEVMGSKSTYLLAHIGGLDGRALCEGDELEINQQTDKPVPPARAVPAEFRKVQVNPQTVRVIMGPQDEAFTDKGIRTFFDGEYKVTHESDRMGCRFEGPKIQHKNGPDIVSDGIAPGSIQVVGSGMPIVMMADRQTTGGYTKIATVITPDLWKLAQARTGDSFKFSAISVDEAQELYREYENAIRQLPEKMMPVNIETDVPSGIKQVLLVRVADKEYRVEIQEMTKQ